MKLKSIVNQGHYAFRSDIEIASRVNESIYNTYSDVAIVVKRGSEVIGHLPERLAESCYVFKVYSSNFKHPICTLQIQAPICAAKF